VYAGISPGCLSPSPQDTVTRSMAAPVLRTALRLMGDAESGGLEAFAALLAATATSTPG